MAAVSKCHRLEHLDLSFVSESISMFDLLRSTSQLTKLRTFHLPRSASLDTDMKYHCHGGKHHCTWPPNLRKLQISGGIRDEDIMLNLKTIPDTVTSLVIKHAPRLTIYSIGPFLQNKGDQLRSLEILAPIPRIRDPSDFDGLLSNAPNLVYLQISMEFISNDFMQNFLSNNDSLRRLYIHCLGPHRTIRGPFDRSLLEASAMLAYDNYTGLRVLGLHRILSWHETHRREVSEADEYLKALAREDGPGAAVSEQEAGVVIFGSAA